MSKNKNYNPDVTEEIEDKILNQEENTEVVDPVETVGAEPMTEVTVEEPTPEPVVNPIGVVTGCSKLNVRKGPSKSTESLAVLDALDEVEVFEGSSTSAFYKVRTASGVEGFCMKKFISIK